MEQKTKHQTSKKSDFNQISEEEPIYKTSEEKYIPSVINVRGAWNIKQVLFFAVLIFFIALLLLFAVYYGVQKGLTSYVIAENFAEESVVIQTERHLSDEEMFMIIERAQQDIHEMNIAGFNTYYVTDLYLVMEDESNDNIIDYSLILKNAQLIRDAKENAFYAQDLLSLKEEEIIEFEDISGLNATEAWNMYNKAADELKNERYDNAKNMLNGITPELDRTQIEATRLSTKLFAQKNRLIEWLTHNSIKILFSLLFIVIFCVLFYKKAGIFMLRKKIIHAHIEEEVLADLMKKAQIDYYNERKITKSMYIMKTEMYKARMEEIKSMLPVLQKELQKKQQ